MVNEILFKLLCFYFTQKIILIGFYLGKFSELYNVGVGLISLLWLITLLIPGTSANQCMKSTCTCNQITIKKTAIIFMKIQIGSRYKIRLTKDILVKEEELAFDNFVWDTAVSATELNLYV